MKLLLFTHIGANSRPHKIMNLLPITYIEVIWGHQKSTNPVYTLERLAATKTDESLVFYTHRSHSRHSRLVKLTEPMLFTRIGATGGFNNQWIHCYVHASEWLEATHVIESIVIYTHRREAADISECVVTYAHWTLHKIQGVKYSLIRNSSATESAPGSSGGPRGFRIQLLAAPFEHLICFCD